MALHLNLYHEVEKQKAINRRDPLKLSLMGLGAIALGFAGYYALQLTVSGSVANELGRVEGELAKLKPQAEIAKTREAELNVAIKTSEALVKRIEGRFYWAPVLETLIRAVPREVQITKLNGETVIMDKAGVKQEHATMALDGLCAAPEPRRIAEEFRVAIAEQFGTRFDNVAATFRTLEESPEQAVVEGVATPTATFSITLYLEPRDPAKAPGREVAQQR